MHLKMDLYTLSHKNTILLKGFYLCNIPNIYYLSLIYY